MRGRDRPIHQTDIDRVAAVGPARQLHLVAGHVRTARCIEHRRVNRHLHQDTIAGLAEGLAGEVESTNHTGQEHERLGRHAPTIEAFETLQDHRPELRRFVRVAEDAVLDALAQRADYRFGARGNPYRPPTGVAHPAHSGATFRSPYLVAR